ncbi:hypothetical protein FNV43_RR09925 [Rhamnella rubrinervis]|uniref:Uncharacterized protein n=1 Tax=Rhamnella rubrinervis TaxID=2594499 RepID=A0A8K0MKE7_9ROSA|nr:hypothetical protein FNV43_RR09925 [Rhamnella rubrinervis]
MIDHITGRCSFKSLAIITLANDCSTQVYRRWSRAENDELMAFSGILENQIAELKAQEDDNSEKALEVVNTDESRNLGKELLVWARLEPGKLSPAAGLINEEASRVTTEITHSQEPEFDIMAIRSVSWLMTKRRKTAGSFLLAMDLRIIKIRSFFWNTMSVTVSTEEMPWYIIGDLNEVINDYKKHGGRSINKKGFLNTFIQKVAAIDLGFNGSRFTWSNNQSGGNWIREFLDIACVNREWLSLFPNALVTNLLLESSDHNLILLMLAEKAEVGIRPFMYIKAWSIGKSCIGVVRRAWNRDIIGGMEAHRTVKRLANTVRELKRWNRTHFGIAHERIKSLENQLAALQDEDSDDLSKEGLVKVEIQEQRRRLKSIQR